MIRRGMSANGVNSGYTIYEDQSSVTAYDPDAPGNSKFANTDRVRVSAAVARANDASGFTFMVVVQNFSDERQCFRARFRDLPSGQVLKRLQVNDVVDPGRSYIVLAISDYGRDSVPAVHTGISVMSWAPNMAAPNGQKCRSSAPFDMDGWANRDGYSG